MQAPDPAWNSAAFAAALLDPQAPVPAGVGRTDGSAMERRFAVYRNNVAHSLVTAMADIFPGVAGLAGRDRFTDAVRLYLAGSPPGSPILAELGRDFPDFLDRFPPARQQMPWLAGVARLERAWLDAWHAADAPLLDPAQLATISPEQLAQTRFLAHPAAMIVRSDFAIVRLLEAGRNGQAADPAGPGCALVSRPHLAVMIEPLDAAAAGLARCLLAGGTLGTAAEDADGHPDFELGRSLGLLLAAGAFAGIAPPPEPEGR
ncbi:DUF2063 domain-containing protein [Zhengella mangrovi]|uniref:DUF2063 domain-containing protein n=1 Tax=Zhengella mangrovi TaxID=1982044 RepID=A0A2G1QP07_9HYPH|nr:DNA-binding domain-containing protein [Zhengella mangrovi]PHP67225.1 DUF2063 domain-containing protein [Zhengella mangrovi]